MRRFDQTAQLIDGNEGNVVASPAMNDDRLSTIGRLVHESFQIRPGLRVCGFRRHTDLYGQTVQIIPTGCNPSAPGSPAFRVSTMNSRDGIDATFNRERRHSSALEPLNRSIAKKLKSYFPISCFHVSTMNSAGWMSANSACTIM